ncbi:NAD(P)(+) transhydrogenase (Re/Si-specific) subunit beta [Nocardioides flavescens]|uniref:proton-translocating NAD(P)(+) transhydrogenase n=1 Tax=Nocardioides flavescens TaxID=2691959 RepID=A0A6L7EZ09_9ACTN|nr:hypothetical protein [Nocardioides flavescens]
MPDLTPDLTGAVVVPGFGLAAAQAHHALRALDAAYGDTWVHLVHPLAGRYPGHLDLLLDLAGVPWERRVGPEHDLRGATVLAVGANDVLTWLELSPERLVAVTDGGPSFDGTQAPVLGDPRTTLLRGDAGEVLRKLQPTTP